MACNSIGENMRLEVKNTDTLLSKIDDVWMYKNGRFNGFMIQVENDGRVVYKLPIVNGKEQGVAVGYYNSGEKLLERPFINGKKQGIF